MKNLNLNKETLSKWEYLKTPDIFGRRVNLLYEQKNYFQTYLGACATILLILCILGVALKDCLKLFSYSIKTLDYYETSKDPLNDRYKKVPFSPEKTRLAIFYNDLDMNSSIIQPIFFDNYERNMKPRVTQISCHEIDFPQEVERNSAKMSKYCYEFETLDLVARPFKLELIKCTGSKECMPLDKINKKLHQLKIDMFLEVNNNEISKKNLVTKLQRFSLIINPKFRKRILIDLIEFQSITNGGLFYGANCFKGLLYKNVNEHLTDLNPEKELLTVEMNVVEDRKIFVEKKIYQFQDFLSLIGGLMKGATVFMFVIIWPFREILFYKKLTNEMFYLCSDQTDIESIMKMTNEKELGELIKKKENDDLASQKSLKIVDPDDDPYYKSIVDKILSLKKNFQSEGLFYKILNNEKMSKKERRESMRVIGLGRSSLSQLSNFFEGHQKKREEKAKAKKAASGLKPRQRLSNFSNRSDNTSIRGTKRGLSKIPGKEFQFPIYILNFL